MRRHAQAQGTVYDDGGDEFEVRVDGTHRYRNAGGYSISALVTQSGGYQFVLASSISVNNVDIEDIEAKNFGTFAGASTGSVVVATFTDPNFASQPADFQATIDYTYEAAPIIGTIVRDGADSDGHPIYEVTGAYTYTATGSYDISIQIVDEGTYYY